MGKFDNRDLGEMIKSGAASVSANNVAPDLVAMAVKANLVTLSAHGAVVVETGQYTGRSPKDKFIVKDDLTRNLVWWDNTAAMSETQFEALLDDFIVAMKGKPLYLQQLYAGADTAHQTNVEVYTESPWHALFIRNLLIRPAQGALKDFLASATILHMPSFKADPARHGSRTDTVIALDLTHNIVLIGGTAYAGEIKKSVFSMFNFHAPSEGVLPMHCSANIGKDGDTALFFGLSGTGKTTLSTDPHRVMIGDDEHGWTDTGVFNLEGGCYAKTVNLSRKNEPEIYAATEKFGTVLENVILDPVTREPNFDDQSLTENTRAAYPLYIMDNVSRTGMGGIPRNVVLLTADAFGVLPPIARLTPEQAIYHFLSGYTAKVAGTERGITEPQATFSTCFGAPFMSLHPTVYGRMLKKRLRESMAECWLLNTGWTGGAYGTGHRISIKDTRALLNAAISGELANVEMRTDEVFGMQVPVSVPGVDAKLLTPRETWADKAAYDAQAKKLVGLFEENFVKFAAADPEVAEAGPRLRKAAE